MSLRKRLAALWPRNRFPRLRKRLADVYRSAWVLNSHAKFRLWSLASRFRFGSARWVSVYGDLKLRVLTTDYRAYRVAVAGGTQAEKIALWKQIVGFGPESCLDVGANYGEFSVTAAALGAASLISIEANPLLIPCLRESLGPYRAASVVHAAVSDKDSQSTFFYNSDETGSASLSKGGPSGSLFGVEISSAEVPTRRLDTLVPEILGRQPRSLVIKVDVEGFEEQVLAGASGLLEGVEWWRALIEFNPVALQRAGDDPARLWQKLRAFSGFVVGSEAVPASRLLEFEAELPAEVPTGDCDVLVGAGKVSSTVSSAAMA